MQRSFKYGLLDQAQEDALHASRLLQVEERPFQRVTRSLLSKDSLLRTLPRQLPSPPPEGESEETETPIVVLPDAFQLQKFREELLLDFAALESSIIRIQMIQSSNERERARYAEEKAKILSTAQAVKENSAQLRIQLQEAQEIMQQRKGYDDLAAKILEDSKIQSREESQAEIDKLGKEIEDLEQESLEYDATWIGRREQFDRVVAEGEAMIRLIRGIKDEPEEDKNEAEAMEEDEDNANTKGEVSYAGTPTPGGRTPLIPVGDDTVTAEAEDNNEDEGVKSKANPQAVGHDLPDLEMADDPPESAERTAIQKQEDEMDET